MLVLAVVCICTMFYVLYSKVHVDRRIGTIVNMSYIYYRQVPIVLTVRADYLYFHHIGFSLLSSMSSILYCCFLFLKTVEVMYHIEGCNIIHCLLLKMGTLVITYIAYEENTLGHSAPIYVP